MFAQHLSASHLIFHIILSISTLCSEKYSHSRFLVYLHGKCLDFHKIFGKFLGGNKYSIGEKLDIFLLLVTSL